MADDDDDDDKAKDPFLAGDLFPRLVAERTAG
jgi:hypothetical protein